MSNLRYTVCVRVQENYCWIKWETDNRDSFSFGSPFRNNYSLSYIGASGQSCNNDDFISIDEGITEDFVPEDDRICGKKFLKYNYVICEFEGLEKVFNFKINFSYLIFSSIKALSIESYVE